MRSLVFLFSSTINSSSFIDRNLLWYIFFSISFIDSFIYSISFIVMMFHLCYIFFSTSFNCMMFCIWNMLFFNILIQVSIERMLISCLYDQPPHSEYVLVYLILLSLSQECIIPCEECWEFLLWVNHIFNTVYIQQLQNKKNLYFQ